MCVLIPHSAFFNTAIVCQVSWQKPPCRKKINPYPIFGTRATPAVPPKLTYKKRPPHRCTYYAPVFDNAAPLRQHYSNLQVKTKTFFRAALLGPFGKSFVPHSHRRRLSLTKWFLLTIPYHRFTMGLYTPKKALSTFIF